jgi:hypothetical protein
VSNSNQTENSADKTKGNNGKLILSFMLLLPIVVILSSTLLYKAAEKGNIDLGTVNLGELIDPPVNLADIAPVQSNGDAFEFNKADSKWAFLVIGDDECRGDCDKILYLTRQTRTAMGKKSPRVERIYLSTADGLSNTLATHVEAEHPKLRTGSADYAELENLLSGVEGDFDSPLRFYLVDPKGWIMMMYRLSSTDKDTINALGKDVLKDMNRLLK